MVMKMTRKRLPVARNYQHGFTLIEILLVVVIIGMMMAVIVPRAQRARVDAKYTIVRQNAGEIANWGMEWAKRNLESQEDVDTCNLKNYVNTLCNLTSGYTGDASNTNWPSLNGPAIDLTTSIDTCRLPLPGSPNPLNNTVEDIMPSEKLPRNPFNGLSYFNTGNGVNTGPVPGALFLGDYTDTNGDTHYYLVYEGTGSTAASEWHAGMGSGTTFTTVAEFNSLRNGVFMARLR